MRKLLKNKITIGVIICSLFFLNIKNTFAATGTIIGNSAYAWGENIGWINFKTANSNIPLPTLPLLGLLGRQTMAGLI